ncbi:MAG: 50S ribosomal protein L25 [Elusimicrobiales bacterium]
MNRYLLNAVLRNNPGMRGGLRNLRKNGMIPAVVYGGKDKPVNVAVNIKEFLRVIKEAGNSVITLRYENYEDSVIIKEIQRDVVTDQIIHIDFNRVTLDKKIDVKVPIKFVGKPYGVKTQGGIVEYNMRELSVRCLAQDIPNEIAVDISHLKIGDSIRIKDIKVEKFEIRENPENIVISVISAKEEELATTQAPQPKEPQAPQPEVIEKGKKDEKSKEENKP